MMIIDHGQPGENAEQAPCAGEPALCPPTPWSAAPAAVPSTGDDHYDHVYKDGDVLNNHDADYGVNKLAASDENEMSLGVDIV